LHGWRVADTRSSVGAVRRCANILRNRISRSHGDPFRMGEADWAREFCAAADLHWVWRVNVGEREQV
jgi:hypothetical protein